MGCSRSVTSVCLSVEYETTTSDCAGVCYVEGGMDGLAPLRAVQCQPTDSPIQLQGRGVQCQGDGSTKTEG